MLTSTIQKSIQRSYKNLQHQLDNFVPRRAQNYLTSEIAKTLSGHYHKTNRMIVAEAGTGIGKSLSYLMAAVPIAVLNNRKLIISTATVALQEQLLHKDMPLYRRLTDLNFEFRIAKGRQRYCCAQKLANTCSMVNEQIALFEHKPTTAQMSMLQAMHQQLTANQWDGEKDSWPTTIDDALWRLIASDKHTCSAAFPHHRHCPYHKARQELEIADVIIANHSLVMADAALGGGVILPEPEQSIYVFDEAHHLPQIARDHSAADCLIKAAQSWLGKLNLSVNKFLALTDEQRGSRFKIQLQESLQQLIPSLKDLEKYLITLPYEDGRCRFVGGELPEWLASESIHLKTYAQKAESNLGKVADLIAERVKDGTLTHKIADPVLSEIGFYLQKLEGLAQAWSMMAEPNPAKSAPFARWIEHQNDGGNDFLISVSPIDIGWKLNQQLWSRCVGSVLVSATLRALNSFQYFCRQAGIDANESSGVQFLALASPFHYDTQGELMIPEMREEPQSPSYTTYLITRIPEFILPQKANLVLFSSYWQMHEVADALLTVCKQNDWLLQIQGNASRTVQLKKHEKYIKSGKTSVLFGTGSFSEGLDLPGSLLENLIITKIPFAVPTSPVEQAHAEYITRNGGNPFLQIAIPEASRKLIQSVGRLLRKEQDSGRVVLLDRRIVTKRYGKSLLDSLPPFKRIIESSIKS